MCVYENVSRLSVHEDDALEMNVKRILNYSHKLNSMKINLRRKHTFE